MNVVFLLPIKHKEVYPLLFQNKHEFPLKKFFHVLETAACDQLNYCICFPKHLLIPSCTSSILFKDRKTTI